MRTGFSLRRRALRLRVSRLAGDWTLAAALALAPFGAQAQPGAAQAPARAETPARAEAAVAVDARLVEKGQETLVEFDLSRAVEVSAFVLADPDRVVVELPDVAFRIEGDRRSAARGLVSSYRYGQFSPGRTRVVIDLARPAKILRAEAATFSRDGLGPARLTVALAPETREAFRAAARRNLARAKESEPTPAPVSPASSDKPVVVIDPGHGGVDSGAISHALADQETLEKSVVLDFARDLARKLEADGGFKVVLTRSADVFVSLDERVRIARAANAALFVSIHADSLRQAQGVSGATIYTVSDRASDAEAARIAESENAADRAAGVDSAESAGDVADILFDLTRRETRAFANVFSRDLVARLSKATTMHRIPNRAAGFKVLKAPDVPSVLIELGYLSSDKDVKAMTSPEWRARSAQAVSDSIRAFMATAAVPTRARDAAAPGAAARPIAAASP